MLKFEEICELIRLVGSSKVTSVEVEHAGSRIRIEGGAPAAVQPVAVAEAVTAAKAAGGAESAKTLAAAAPEPVQETGGEAAWQVVTSPIVGTFYRAPNPDAESYVKVGDFVDKGTTLCIVEAMKLMNEIECDVAGKIVRVFPQNEQPVEFGERLFAVEPA